MSDLIVIRPALRWVGKAAPRTGDYLVCWVKPGRDWWDLDDRVIGIPGHRPMTDARSPRTWHAIPADRIADLEAIEAEYPNRLRVHYAR